MIKVIAELERLNALRVAGLLSTEEFAAAKRVILSHAEPEDTVVLGSHGTDATVVEALTDRETPAKSHDAEGVCSVPDTLPGEQRIASSCGKPPPNKPADKRALIASAIIIGTLGFAGWSVLTDSRDVAPVSNPSYQEDTILDWNMSMETAPPPVATPPSASNSVLLDGIIIFESPATCEAAPPLDEIFKKLVTVGPESEGWPISAGTPLTIPGFPTPLQPSFSSKASIVLSTLAINGTWHGLTIKEIEIEFVEGGDRSQRTLRFANDASEAREILNNLGFNLPVENEVRRHRGEGFYTEMAIRSDGDGTALECTRLWGDME